MPVLRTKQELASLAKALVARYALVWHKGHLYMPVHFQTKLPSSSLPPEHTTWVSLDTDLITVMANTVTNILFATESEYRSFYYMLRQLAERKTESEGILVRLKAGHVELLREDGKLVPVTGDFVANYLDVPYDPESPLTGPLYEHIVEWVNGMENAESLLYHLATALQPNWSAVKYILLIGKGRNGKSTLLKMVHRLLGKSNVSEIKRQDMAVRSPIITDLNGKLLNIVFDGPAEFVRDSSTEKTLIAGESLSIELKYENSPYQVQTNALFIEGLQREPKTSDKSSALQDRLVRFHFPKKFAVDLEFEAKMLDENMVAALLDLLLKHWVNKDEVAEKLRLTGDSMDMQMEAVWAASPVLRFLEYTSTRDVLFLKNIVERKVPVDTFLAAFRPWLDSNGYKNMEDDYLLQQLNDHFITDRKSFRVDNKPTTKRYIKTVLPDTMNTIQLLMNGQSTHKTEDEEILAD